MNFKFICLIIVKVRVTFVTLDVDVPISGNVLKTLSLESKRVAIEFDISLKVISVADE